MAQDDFIKFEGIDGESTDDKHPKWIEMLSYSVGVSQMASAVASSSGGATSQRASFSDFSFVKLVDSASPMLFLKCASGAHIDEVKVELCRAAGEEKLVYMKLTMKDVVISSYNLAGGSGSGEGTESISLNYGKIQKEYTKQKRAGGGAAGTVSAGWDLEKNKKI